jgi:hypothetical protein
MYVFKGTGWFLAGLSVALGGYMVMSQGAAERARLRSLDNRIVEARKDIRNLETEFATRASLAQLERWNGEGIGMAAPAAQQFVEGETALANLDRAPEAEIQQAALVVPAAAPRIQPEAAIASRDPAGATAQNKAGARPEARAVAMVDRSQLLSSSTMGDIERTAASERQALR